VGLFRSVDQEKEEREGSRGHRALFDGESVYLAQEILERHGITIAVASSARRNAQLFHDLERLLPLETLDYTPQRTGKPADVLVEWDVLRPRLQATPAALQLDCHSHRS